MDNETMTRGARLAASARWSLPPSGGNELIARLAQQRGQSAVVTNDAEGRVLWVETYGPTGAAVMQVVADEIGREIVGASLLAIEHFDAGADALSIDPGGAEAQGSGNQSPAPPPKPIGKPQG